MDPRRAAGQAPDSVSPGGQDVTTPPRGRPGPSPPHGRSRYHRHHRLIGLAAELSQPSNHDARTLVEILEATSAENLTVAQRARRAGVGVTVLREQVLAETGLTPHEVVLRTRLARAQHLLTSSELSITQIATQVGYDDPAYFSRFFRARTGMAPQDFRQLP